MDFLPNQEFIATSTLMLRLLELTDRFAQTDFPVLITGETGTGKELIARRLFRHSLRSKASFVDLNCASIPAEVFESELFGHERGAFSGAVSKRKGLLEVADNGTLFLDELSQMPLAVQSKLLRVLETGDFFRIGSRTKTRSNFRVIAAMNSDPQTSIGNNLLREDLFHRLGVLSIGIPPLRERPEDILPLANYFLSRYGSCHIPSEAILSRLLEHDWPGNVRELRNVIIRAVSLQDFSFSELKLTTIAPEHSARTAFMISELENVLVLQTLQKTGGNRAATAKSLGISESTIYRRLRAMRESK